MLGMILEIKAGKVFMSILEESKNERFIFSLNSTHVENKIDMER